MTTPSKSTFKPLKAKLATFLSTLSLTLVLALPSTVNAASDSSSVDAICFNTGTLIYTLVSVQDEERAVELMNKMMITDLKTKEDKMYADGYNRFISELFYFGMNSRSVFKGDRLKALIRSKCPSVYAKTNGG